MNREKRFKLSQVTETVKSLRQFLERGVWDIDPNGLNLGRRLGLRLLRVTSLMSAGVREERLRLHASALTFSTLMSLIPLLALAFSILRGLGYGDVYVDRLSSLVTQELPSKVQEFMEDVISVAENSNFTQLGGLGGLLLFVLVIQMLARIESSFNHIWFVARSRTLVQKVSHYISVTVVVPLMMVSAITLTAKFQLDTSFLAAMGILHMVPFVVVWMAFTFLYMFMPNTRVTWRAGIGSAFVGAILWVSWLQIYIRIQPGVSSYNLLYGAMASILIFLAWLYVNWMVILLGAHLTYAIQNEATFRPENDDLQLSPDMETRLVIMIAQRAAKTLEDDAPMFGVDAFSRESGIPPNIVEWGVQILVNGGLLGQVADQDECYTLLKSPNRVMVKDLVRLVLTNGGQKESRLRERLQFHDLWHKLDAGMAASTEDASLATLLQNTTKEKA